MCPEDYLLMQSSLQPHYLNYKNLDEGGKSTQSSSHDEDSKQPTSLATSQVAEDSFSWHNQQSKIASNSSE